nr:MAG TPA: hypothetical protein [Caudoviricetes sp.]
MTIENKQNFFHTYVHARMRTRVDSIHGNSYLRLRKAYVTEPGSLIPPAKHETEGDADTAYSDISVS